MQERDCRDGAPAFRPVIAEAFLRRSGRPYRGDIRPGDVFAWEPDLPHARELCVVTRLTGPREDEVIRHARGTAVICGTGEPLVWSRPLDGDDEWWNTESRFREAVVPTLFRPHPPRRVGCGWIR
jgi:hypothetical protein